MGTTGILHPGAMGASIGAALVGQGADVLWVSSGRSEATRARAEADQLQPVDSLASMVEQCDLIISVCPPAFALDVAEAVAARGFVGTYLDANAISPNRAREIEGVIAAAGATFVDGGIVGPPARHAGLTVLYLSGPQDSCDNIAARFAGSPLGTHIVGTDPGAASAVKMAFAAWTKGTSALLLAIRALAEAEGVTEGLDHAWSILTPDLPDRLAATAASTGPKAWRFASEMEEIATTFADANLPSGFHEAAAEIYDSLADLRDAPNVTVDDVITRLNNGTLRPPTEGTPE